MLRMRQICLVAADLDGAQAQLEAAFGLAVCHRDPGVGRFGLHNFLMPIGNAFLEVVSPLEEGTAGGRFLERRGGDGGYMVIMQCDDVAARRAQLEALGVRRVLDGGNEETEGIQLHPKDVPGAIAELRQQHAGSQEADGPWHPAGPDWLPHRRADVVSRLTAAELQSAEPAAMASRWGEVLQREVGADEEGNAVIALDDAVLRFVQAADGRGDGLGGLDVAAVDRGRAGEVLEVCGVRFRFV